MLKRSDLHYQFMPKVEVTCCVLHNICESPNEVCLRSWQEEVGGMRHDQPRCQTSQAQPDDDAKLNRNNIYAFLQRNFIASESFLDCTLDPVGANQRL